MSLTVTEAASRFAVEPAVIDTWNDTVATDPHTDLLPRRTPDVTALAAGGGRR